MSCLRWFLGALGAGTWVSTGCGSQVWSEGKAAGMRGVRGRLLECRAWPCLASELDPDMQCLIRVGMSLLPTLRPQCSKPGHAHSSF